MTEPDRNALGLDFASTRAILDRAGVGAPDARLTARIQTLLTAHEDAARTIADLRAQVAAQRAALDRHVAVIEAQRAALLRVRAEPGFLSPATLAAVGAAIDTTSAEPLARLIAAARAWAADGDKDTALLAAVAALDTQGG